YEVARNEKEAFKLITSKNFDFRRKVILEKKPDFLLGNSRYSEGKIKINKYRPTYVELSLSLKTPSILVFSELYYPEWKAYVNGKETEIYRANFLSRAILLKAGNQKVIFKYHPTSLIRGSLVSGVTCFAYLLAILYFIKKPKLKLKISANN
ncbi:MAG: YfhO family protein, partial [Candidatus Aenigmatarchaeota archaeon]